MKITGRFVEDVRRKLGVSQGRLAKEARMHQPSLSRIESAAEKAVGDKHWSQLRDAFFNLKVGGLDLADRSRETDEQVFVRKADDGTVAVVSLQGSSGDLPSAAVGKAGGPVSSQQTPSGWIPFSCRLTGGAEVARLDIKGSLSAAELSAVRRWLKKVEAAAEAFAEVDQGSHADE